MPSSLDVPGNTLGRVEVQAASRIRAARQRRDGKDAGEILHGDRTALHAARITRNLSFCLSPFPFCLSPFPFIFPA